MVCTALGIAQEVSFTAETNARQVVAGGAFTVTFTLENASGTNFTPPSLGQFDMASGPAQASSTTIINGRMSQQRRYTYTLMTTRPGTYTIGPATIRADGRTLQTNPVQIEVVEGKVTDPAHRSPEDEVFLRAVISSNRAYPGEQLRLDYKVYTTVSVRNYQALKEDSYSAFYYRYIQEFGRRTAMEVVDGVQYHVQTIKSLALFPQQTGIITIEPMVANLALTVREERPSFFFGGRAVPATVTSEPVTVEVLPLPNGAPQQFTGAVGRYNVRGRVNRSQLTTDDALVLSVQISGDGDPRRWTPPVLDALGDDFEVYPPKIIRDESVDQQGAVRHTRTIEYLLVPRITGAYALQAGFTFFDPDSAAYRTMFAETFPLQITPGTRSGQPRDILVAGATQQELRGLKPFRSGRSTGVFLFSPLYYMLIALPIAGLIAVWWLRRRNDRFNALDPEERKRLRARTLADKYLREAKQNLTGTQRAFYDSISRAIFTYLSAKLKIPASELTKENIARHLQDYGMPATVTEQILDILSRGEHVLYAGASDGLDVQDVYNQARKCIEEVESLAERRRKKPMASPLT